LLPYVASYDRVHFPLSPNVRAKRGVPRRGASLVEPIVRFACVTQLAL
jgi:hypothetical protein